MGAAGPKEHKHHLAKGIQKSNMQDQQKDSSHCNLEKVSKLPPKSPHQNLPRGKKPQGHQGPG
eukprot:8412491-Karenia_brevis.AAC.1